MRLRPTALAALTTAALLAACGGSSEPAAPGVEPNDAAAQASPIPLPAAVAASIATASDLDWYAFTVPAGGASVRFETFDATGAACDPSGLNVDPYLAVYGADGSTLLGGDDDGGQAPYCEDVTVVLPAGPAYVMVGGIPPVPFNYTLKLSIVP